MTPFNTLRTALAALASAAVFALGAGAAAALPTQVTIDFGTGGDATPTSPYTEDGFELAGIDLLLDISRGNPPWSISLDLVSTSLTLTRSGGGAFSLVSFDYSCIRGDCDFNVGNTLIDSGSTDWTDFATATPAGFTDVTSVLFTWNSSLHRLDNIVVSYNDMPAVPLPAGLPLLLSGVAGLGLLARRKRKAT